MTKLETFGMSPGEILRMDDGNNPERAFWEWTVERVAADLADKATDEWRKRWGPEGCRR